MEGSEVFSVEDLMIDFGLHATNGVKLFRSQLEALSVKATKGGWAEDPKKVDAALNELKSAKIHDDHVEDVPADISFEDGGDEDDEVAHTCIALREKYSYGSLVLGYFASLKLKTADAAIKVLQGDYAQFSREDMAEAISLLQKTIALIPHGAQFGEFQMPADTHPTQVWERALSREIRSADIVLTNYSILTFVSQFEFPAAWDSKKITFKLGTVSVTFDQESGEPCDDEEVKAFLNNWMVINPQVRFTYKRCLPIDKIMTALFVGRFIVKVVRDNWSVTLDQQSKEHVMKRHLGKAYESHVVPAMNKLRDLLEQKPLPKPKQGQNASLVIYDILLVCANALGLPKGVADAILSRMTKVFESDDRYKTAMAASSYKELVKVYGAGSVADVVKVREQSKSRRNQGPREQIAKRCCSPNLRQFPNAYNVAYKFHQLLHLPELKEYLDACPAISVYGTAKMAFKEVILARFPKVRDIKWHDINQSYLGVKGGVKVDYGNILDVAQGRGRLLIDDSFVTKDLEGKPTNQYGKVEAMIKSGYGAIITKLMFDRDEPTLTTAHPVLQFAKWYEKIAYRRMGKQNSGEYFVLAWGKRDKEAIDLDFELVRFRTFCVIAAAQMRAADEWMNLVTDFGLGRSLPGHFHTPGKSAPWVVGSKIDHVGILNYRTGGRRILTKVDNNLKLPEQKEGEEKPLDF